MVSNGMLPGKRLLLKLDAKRTLCAASAPDHSSCARSRPSRFYNRRNASSRPEIADNMRPHRIACLHHILQNLVDDVLLKYAEIAVAEQVLFP